MIRAEASLDQQLDTFEALHETIIEEARVSPVSATETHTALGDFLVDALPRAWLDPRWPWHAAAELGGTIAVLAGGLDLPYPPDYPKMPGEPKRVQPSRDRDRPKD